MYNRVVIAGASGFTGEALNPYWKERAKDLVLISRHQPKNLYGARFVPWDGQTLNGWEREIDGADLLINLCGRTVNCRYTEANRRTIYASRLRPTALLGEAVQLAQNPPKVWIQMVSSTIYRYAEDRAQTESGDIGTGFSVDVCKQWEDSLMQLDLPATRRVLLRTAIVLGRGEGMFPRVVRLAKLGLGGRQGTGKQIISWIHLDDLCRITEFAAEHAEDGLTLNAAAPEAVSNTEFMRLIREAVGVPFGLPTPTWMLSLGMKLIGSEPELILKSRWVAPEELLRQGFNFFYPKAEVSIRELLSRRF